MVFVSTYACNITRVKWINNLWPYLCPFVALALTSIWCGFSFQRTKNALESNEHNCRHSTAGVIFILRSADTAPQRSTQSLPAYRRRHCWCPYRHKHTLTPRVYHSIHLCSYLTRMKCAKHNYVNVFGSTCSRRSLHRPSTCHISTRNKKETGLNLSLHERICTKWKKELWLTFGSNMVAACVYVVILPFWRMALFAGNASNDRASKQFLSFVSHISLFSFAQQSITTATQTTKARKIILWTLLLRSSIFMAHAIWINVIFFPLLSVVLQQMRLLSLQMCLRVVPIADKYWRLFRCASSESDGTTRTSKKKLMRKTK